MTRDGHNPGQEDWNAVLKILSYVRYTKIRGLIFTRGQGFGVSVYVDPDYAGTRPMQEERYPGRLLCVVSVYIESQRRKQVSFR